MILHNNQKVVETNMTGAGQFTIKASAKAFKILSDGLYSDKIRAVIRELSCNGLDSHTGAKKKDTPIDVHLPNSFEPWFSVRDYGLGLSKDNVMHLYTTYFESTKTESNDQIGALGLGSKAPFSYTDSFTVTSNFDGVKSIYTAYIGSSGEPAIQHLSDMETDEINGVEIKFGVQKSDFYAFREKAEITYRPFVVKPNISGNTEYTPKIHKGKVIYSGDDWRIYDTDSYYNNYKSAIQGNIEYTIDKNNIDKLSEKAKFILDQTFVIDFDLGLLDISASRESLGYDKQTQKNIIDKLESVYDELVIKINESVKTSKSLYDAIVRAKKTASDLYGADVLVQTLKWNGKALDKSFDIRDFPDIISYYPSGNASKVKRAIIDRTLVPMEKYVFVYNNEKSKTKGITKIRTYVYEENVNVVMFRDMKFIDSIGNPEFLTSTDDLEDVVKVAGTKSAVGAHFKTYSHTSSSYWQFGSSFIKPQQLYFKDGETVYYLPIKGKEATINENAYSIVEFAKYIGVIDENKIIGIKQSHLSTKKWAKDKDSLGWNLVNLEDYVQGEFDKIKDKQMFNNVCELILDTKSSKSYRFDRIISNSKSILDEIKGTKFHDIVTKVIDTKSISKGLDISDNAVSYISRRMKSQFSDVETQLFSHYPMLKLADSFYNQNEKDIVKSYINMVDSKAV
jgi:hypothetical protein